MTAPTPTIVAGRDRGSLEQDQEEEEAGGSGHIAGIVPSQSFSGNGTPSFSNHNGPGMVVGGRRGTVEESIQGRTRPCLVGDIVQYSNIFSANEQPIVVGVSLFLFFGAGEMTAAMEEERPSDRNNGDPQPPAVANEAVRHTGNGFDTMTDEERAHSAPGGAVETGQGHQEEEGSPNRDVLVPIDTPDHDTGGSTESIRRAFLHLSLYTREFPSSALEEHEDAFRGQIVREVFDAFALSGGTLPAEYNHVVTPRQRFGSMDIRSIHFLEDSCPLDLDPVAEEQFAPAHGMATNLLLGTWDAQQNLEPDTQQAKPSESASSDVFGLGIVPGLCLKRGAKSPFWALNLETVWLGPRGDGKCLEVPGWCLAFQNNDVKRAASVYLLFCVYCATLDDMCGMNPEKSWKPYQLRSLLQRGLSPEGQEKYNSLASSLLDDFNFLRSIYKEGLSLDWRDDLLKKAYAHADWGLNKPREQFGHTFEDGVLVGWEGGNMNGPWGSGSDYLNLRFGWHWTLVDWFLKVERWSWKYSPHDMVHKRYENSRERSWHAGDGMSTYAPAKKVCSFDLGYLVDQMMVPQGEEQAPLSSVQLFALRPTGVDGNPEYHPVDVVRAAPCLVYGVLIYSVYHHRSSGMVSFIWLCPSAVKVHVSYIS